MRRIAKIKNGYRVRFSLPKEVARIYDKTTYSKSFTKPSYSTLSDCKRAAVSHRNALEKNWVLIVSDWETNGGISRVERLHLPDRNRPLCGWRATWREGPQHNRVNREKFFGFIYGDASSEAKAKRKAQAHRQRMIIEHHDPECYRTKFKSF